MSKTPQKARRMRAVVNISGTTVNLEVAGTPGSAPMLHEVKPGEKTELPPGYVEPVPGAGRNTLPSIISRRTTVTWPDGKRRPALVPAEEAEKIVADLKKQGAYGPPVEKADDDGKSASTGKGGKGGQK